MHPELYEYRENSTFKCENPHNKSENSTVWSEKLVWTVSNLIWENLGCICMVKMVLESNPSTYRSAERSFSNVG